VIHDGTANAYFTLAVNPSNPALTSSNNEENTWCQNGAHPSSDICKLIYADCTKEGLMAQICMTGHWNGGSMGATPLSLTITRASSVLFVDPEDDDD
jgi:hypothetical protein